jgi:MoaA/NifB/PqqE/SkfB family radical SAM enzyme
MLTHLAIITTTRCDLKCQHCLRGFPKKHQDFPLDLLDKILTEALPFGASQISLTGGEPHLHPYFKEIVDTIVRYGYKWSFGSNGQKTEPYLFLMERYRNQLTHVTLSIDGARALTHDLIRNKRGSFKNVIAAARLYVEHGYRLQISVCLNQINKLEVVEILELAEDLGATSIRFGGLIPDSQNMHLQLGDEESQRLYQKIIAFRDKSKLRIDTGCALYTRGGVNFCNNLNLRNLTFDEFGQLMFCCDIHAKLAVIGSIRELHLSDLIQSWLRKTMLLQDLRTERIAEGKMEVGFDTCRFCNSYFI